MNATNPLPDTRLKEINQALGQIIQARELLLRAERCGQDIHDDRATLDTMEAQLKTWKAEFFPTAH